MSECGMRTKPRDQYGYSFGRIPLPRSIRSKPVPELGARCLGEWYPTGRRAAEEIDAAQQYPGVSSPQCIAMVLAAVESKNEAFNPLAQLFVIRWGGYMRRDPRGEMGAVRGKDGAQRGDIIRLPLPQHEPRGHQRVRRLREARHRRRRAVVAHDRSIVQPCTKAPTAIPAMA